MRDTALVGAAAFVVRLAVTARWGGAFPPAGDAIYYERIARRIAAGEGYTWVWGDGAVTYAAHYPVGYPALLGAVYVLLGPGPLAIGLLDAVLGSLGAGGIHRLLRRVTSARWALAGAIFVAVHPAFVPYTLAAMTEGPTTALLCVAAGIATHVDGLRARRFAWAVPIGLTLGLAVLVRPQSLVLAPLVGLVAFQRDGWRRACRAGAVSFAMALVVCAPWTVRNCARLGTCALVSVNGGWNLLIGVQTTTGAWGEVDVPVACRTVWDEAAKDACFGRAALDQIREAPGAWLARAPAKWAVTCDYLGAAPWYLHASNPERFPLRSKAVLGAVETLATRLGVAGALVAVARAPGLRRRARQVLCALGLVFVVAGPRDVLPWGGLVPHAWPAYLFLALALAVSLRRGGSVLAWMAAGVVVATFLLHGVFFGAGRYGLVLVPFTLALAFARDIFPSVDADQTIVGGVAPRGSTPREESPSSAGYDAG